MSSQPDLVIRGGTILDGTGRERFDGDVAVRDGRIVAIGEVAGRGAREIDARGRIVTPGFVDIHTHYDGQAVWSSSISPSSWHGVTTVLMGNCGVGFAPCRAGERDMLVKLMEGVEDIPGAVLTEGLTWDWVGFPSYLDLLEGRRYDLDIATQVPHAALRVHAMGERGANREPATADEMAEMARLAVEAVNAGALGFSTSRTLNHRSSDGRLTPTLSAAEDELMAIALGLKQAGKGVLQLVSDFEDMDREFAMLRRLAERSGRPMTISLVQTEFEPDSWRGLLDRIADASSAGLAMKAQVCGRAVGLLYGLELTLNPFSSHPTYKALARLPLADRVREMRRPEVREQILSERPKSGLMGERLFNFERLFPLEDPPDYEPVPEKSIAARAGRIGAEPAALVYDLLLEQDGRAMLYRPLLNYVEGDLEVTRAMLQHPDTLIGLSDGGAHCGIISDASLPTFMLTHWTRDRARGAQLPLEAVVKGQTQDTAAAVGLHDRGVLAPGYKADINVIDLDNLRLHAPEVAYDLPAGGRRLIQRADGYVATVVSGRVTAADGTPTGHLPGQLVRGTRQAGGA